MSRQTKKFLKCCFGLFIVNFHHIQINHCLVHHHIRYVDNSVDTFVFYLQVLHGIFYQLLLPKRIYKNKIISKKKLRSINIFHFRILHSQIQFFELKEIKFVFICLKCLPNATKSKIVKTCQFNASIWQINILTRSYKC